MTELTLPIAFLAGVVSFLSPCVLPLIPGYISMLSGESIDELRAGTGVGVVRRIFSNSIAFVIGFSTVFIALGASATWVGNFLATRRRIFEIVAGIIIIVFGLHLTGLVKIPFLYRDKRIDTGAPKRGLLGSFILGFAFAFGWTPCIGPTLGAVQSLALSGSSATQGALLTLAYCLGLGLPFVIVALAFRRALGVLSVVKRHYALVTTIGGAMLVVVGVLLVTGAWHALVGQLQTAINSFVPAV